VIDPAIRQYAPALATMVELMGAAGSRLRFGEALTMACDRHGLAKPPEAIEAALLTASFRIIANGKIPGAAEA
jgi:hypothetical protein